MFKRLQKLLPAAALSHGKDANGFTPHNTASLLDSILIV
jgi:hypothetical protein